MSLNRFSSLARVSILAAVLKSSAYAAVMLDAEETFTYPAGSIVGHAGGTGWAGAWINPSSQTLLEVNDSGALVFTYESTIQAAGRALAMRYSADTVSKVFLMFDVRFGSQSGGGTPMLRFLDTTFSGISTGAVGNNGYTANYAMLGAGLTQGPAGADTGVSLNTFQ